MSFLNINSEAKSNNKNDSYIQQAQNLWSMLDDMSTNDPQSYKSFIEKTLKEGKEAMKLPEANMCVLVNVTEPKQYKLYMNFFEWNRITPPKTDEDPIPVYGQKIETLKNQESLVNLALSPDILKKYGKAAENAEEREMLINLAIQYVEDQNSVTIDLNSVKLLKDTICFGDKELNASKLTNEHSKKLSNKYEFTAANEALKAMESNQIPDERTIMDNLLKLNINPNEKMKPTKVPLIQDLNPEYEIPKYTIELIDRDEGASIQIKVHLSKISSISECELSIEDNIIKVEANKAFYKPLEISMKDYETKYKFNLEQLEAKFVKKTCILKLTINANKI